MKNKKLLVLFTEDFYRFYYAINLANTIKACNQDITVFISGYAFNFLRSNWKSYDKKKIFSAVFKNYNCDLDQLIRLSVELKIDFFFCETALSLLGIKQNDLNEKLKMKPFGLYSLVSKYKNENIIFI